MILSLNSLRKGSKAFLSLLQTTVEEVYPDVIYKVMVSDTIHQLVGFCLVFVYINANNPSSPEFRLITGSTRKDRSLVQPPLFLSSSIWTRLGKEWLLVTGLPGPYIAMAHFSFENQFLQV
jgi:hypothetical protein